MLGYLLGNTPYYTILFLILPFIVEHKYIKLCVAYSLIMAVDQSTTMLLTSNMFFGTKALFDSVWLLVTFIFVNGRLWKVLSSFIAVSLFINVYTQFDTSPHLLYTYWNEINFILFECIIAILISTSPWYKKLNVWLIKFANYITNKINIKRISLCEEK